MDLQSAQNNLNPVPSIVPDDVPINTPIQSSASITGTDVSDSTNSTVLPASTPVIEENTTTAEPENIKNSENSENPVPQPTTPVNYAGKLGGERISITNSLESKNEIQPTPEILKNAESVETNNSAVLEPINKDEDLSHPEIHVVDDRIKTEEEVAAAVEEVTNNVSPDADKLTALADIEEAEFIEKVIEEHVSSLGEN